MHLLYASSISLVHPSVSWCALFQPARSTSGQSCGRAVLQFLCWQEWLLEQGRAGWAPRAAGVRKAGEHSPCFSVARWVLRVTAAMAWLLCFSCCCKCLYLTWQYLKQHRILNRVEWKRLLTVDQHRLECRFLWDHVPLLKAELLGFLSLITASSVAFSYPFHSFLPFFFLFFCLIPHL